MRALSQFSRRPDKTWDFLHVKNLLGVPDSDGQLWDEWVKYASSFLQPSASSQTVPSQPPTRLRHAPVNTNPDCFRGCPLTFLRSLNWFLRQKRTRSVVDICLEGPVIVRSALKESTIVSQIVRKDEVKNFLDSYDLAREEFRTLLSIAMARFYTPRTKLCGNM